MYYIIIMDIHFFQLLKKNGPGLAVAIGLVGLLNYGVYRSQETYRNERERERERSVYVSKIMLYTDFRIERISATPPR